VWQRDLKNDLNSEYPVGENLRGSLSILNLIAQAGIIFEEVSTGRNEKDGRKIFARCGIIGRRIMESQR
jgi:hypothetical protein